MRVVGHFWIREKTTDREGHSQGWSEPKLAEKIAWPNDERPEYYATGEDCSTRPGKYTGLDPGTGKPTWAVVELEELGEVLPPGELEKRIADWLERQADDAGALGGGEAHAVAGALSGVASGLRAGAWRK